MGHMVIGMDPHKRSATIESIDDRGKVLFQGRFGTDRDGYRAMLAAGRGLPRVFRTDDPRLIHAAACVFRYSS